jgi:hypothetical protein
VLEHHALPDSGDAGFVASTQHLVDLCRGVESEPNMSGDTALEVMRALLAALESSRLGVPVDL